jgi:Xaa-Pro dipeptidase
MATDELRINKAEHKSRIERIQKRLRKSRIDALYLTNSTRILYTTGFSHISTERPLAAVIPNEEPPFFMAPRLEHDHIRQDCPLAGEVLT